MSAAHQSAAQTAVTKQSVQCCIHLDVLCPKHPAKSLDISLHISPRVQSDLMCRMQQSWVIIMRESLLVADHSAIPAMLQAVRSYVTSLLPRSLAAGVSVVESSIQSPSRTLLKAVRDCPESLYNFCCRQLSSLAKVHPVCTMFDAKTTLYRPGSKGVQQECAAREQASTICSLQPHQGPE